MIADLLADPAARDLALELRPDRAPEEVLAHLVWNVLTEPGDGIAGTMREVLGAREALQYALSKAPCPEVPGRVLQEARKRWGPRADAGLVRQAAGAALRAGAALLLPGDEDWPTAASDLGAHAPVVLWVRGSAGLLSQTHRAVSVVGARAATPYGEHMARELAGDLALRGHPIVSGGAYGIDGAAHRAALGVGGETVAFLAGGADRLYPSGHTRLLTEITARGALVSEVPCGTAPTKWRFLARNRLIGALSAATVVVEAGRRSGSLNTAGHAAALGRPLGAVPGPVTSAASAGCHRLLREYDARCVTSAEDVRELLGLRGGPPETAPAPTEADHERTRLCDALGVRSPRTPQEIARRSGLAVERVESLLGTLALEGLVRHREDGWVRAG